MSDKNTQIVKVLHAVATKIKALMNTSTRAEGPIIQEINSMRIKMEDHRVENIGVMTATVLIPEQGTTMSTLIFSVVALCDYALQTKAPHVLPHRLTTAEGTSILVSQGMPLPVLRWPTAMSASEISLSFAYLFSDGRSLDLTNKHVIRFVAALQTRAMVILAEHLLDLNPMDAFKETRALWAYATSKIKRHALFLNTHHRQPRKALPLLVRFPSDVVPYERVKTWLLKVVPAWNGARLREAVAKAFKRTDLRPDEIARTLSLGGNNNLERARGALDVSESVLHEMDIEWLIRQQETELTPVLLRLQDIVIMKLIDNVMEAVAKMTFMDTSVILDSNRTEHEFINPNEWFIRNTLSGWVLLPATQQVDTKPSTFVWVFRHWYPLYFAPKNTDPLELLDD